MVANQHGIILVLSNRLLMSVDTIISEIVILYFKVIFYI